ncbi:D-arabinose 1-dehydrogenase (NAD(P)(+)) ARA2 Ecym_2296 [Eremothecium cymbalariae DBVPG|uniref:NADP-dependent oxidoreductase domain-containing protein n=1 Tax=Eremothecium cymbalariae (strain CBS 270.75 / DBVPG 7215 / KCTC 17166 / NRRL Y-17582) TaxID=931890 RepID=G8JQ36_ERECY|nr:Hypothetical protein Ecym_2296 [Eremothecium cymbalariae DBVPG\
MRTIGAIKKVVKNAPITELPRLILGGATLMDNWYNDDPYSVPTVELLRYAMSRGINAIDTSPYYGPSEIIYGKALQEIKDEFPREEYFICTKVGRVGRAEFNYSKENVRFSVKRSCERLHTDYLDLVYLHDIEYVEYDKIWEALRELRKLKDEGVIRHIGISGYPVDLLLYVSKTCCGVPEIGPLDAVLSYCNLTLQSVVLEKEGDRFFKESNIKVVSNGSVVCMSLLRSKGTIKDHPCSPELLECAQKSIKYAAENGIPELAELATRYSISKWIHKGPTVLGVSTVDELKSALNGYWKVADNGGKLDEKDEAIVAHIQKNIFGDHLNEKWESGIPHVIS